jgi:hypothetical protein
LSGVAQNEGGNDARIMIETVWAVKSGREKEKTRSTDGFSHCFLSIAK